MELNFNNNQDHLTVSNKYSSYKYTWECTCATSPKGVVKEWGKDKIASSNSKLLLNYRSSFKFQFINYWSYHASSSLLSITTRSFLVFLRLVPLFWLPCPPFNSSVWSFLVFRSLVPLFWLPCPSFNSSVWTQSRYFSICSRILLPYFSVFNFPMIFSNCKKNLICYDWFQ